MKTLSKLVAGALLAAAGTALGGHGVATHPQLHLHDDVVRNYQADILFQGGTALAYWALGSGLPGRGGAAVVSSAYAGNAGPGYRLVAVSDFTGDEAADVMWSNGSQLKLWVNDGKGSFTSMPVGYYGGGWEAFAAGDINGDSKSDLFFRNSTRVAYWLMDGAGVIGSNYAGDGGAGYHVVAIADFTGKYPAASRSADVLWANGSQLKLWVGDPRTSSFQPFPLGGYGNGWEPFAAAHMDDDSIADILFRGGTHLAYWQSVGVAQPYTVGAVPPFRYESRYAGDGGAGYRAIGVSEYGNASNNSEGMSDVLWTNGSELKLWFGSCRLYEWEVGCITHEFIPRVMGTYSGGWQPLEMLVPQD